MAVRFQISMSVDGYVAGPDQGLEHPLGVNGQRMHEWAFPTRTFCRMQGREGGTTGPDDDVAAEILGGAGATVMGRNMFGPIRGSWDTAEPWNGWWGDEPPYHHPVYVLTHHARDPVEMEGGTTFHFVTDGIESALQQARAAAGDQDVQIGGGADAVRQYLAAGLVDWFQIHVAPVLLGGGERLFEDGLAGVQTGYEVSRIISTPAATHIRFDRAG